MTTDDGLDSVMRCRSGCACGKSGFSQLYPVKGVKEQLFECVEQVQCVHATILGDVRYCSCPIRIELAQKLHA